MDAKQQAVADKVRAKLDQTKAEVDRLTAKAREAKADARLSMQKEIDDLEKQRKSAEDALKRLQSASAGVFEDAKDGAEKAWAAMSESVEKAKRRFA